MMDAPTTPMKVIGFAGESGAGKTGLVEKLIPIFAPNSQKEHILYLFLYL